MPFMRSCGKTWYRHTGHKLQCNTAQALCMLDKKATITQMFVHVRCWSRTHWLKSDKANKTSAKLMMRWSEPLVISKIVRPNVVLLACS
jgi:hypothetical protein